ncbi:MAG: amidohydrolase [Phenylobacterium sp.]|uniref:amidohydrolase family protein n=1 Tax=Phenylobacterium sp. TaxID=1871053 RepID=UPI001A370AA1|nr:amidohydrolase family protein [Phenylobacterium sp.]MBL8773563.1 amidohydrolase [Phenylobacterium sp.]
MEWPVRADWLAQVREAPLEPGLPIIDAHHHLWKLPHDTYLLDEFLDDADPQRGGHNVVASVFAECAAMYRPDGPAHLRSIGEVEFANGVGAQAASGAFGPVLACAAMFGSADLMLGERVGEVLDIHLARAPERYRGIRPIVCADPHGVLDPWPSSPSDMMESAAFRAGARELQRRNLSLDIWVFHHQLDQVAGLAAALPGLTVILDHIGTPLGMGWYAGRREEVWARWRAGMAAVAACPNVLLKLGGLNMHFNGFDWHTRPKPPSSDELAAANGPYYAAAIELFGPDRCMFESNFPMDKRACSYGVLWNAHKKMAAGFSADEKRLMFHDVAARAYRIEGLPEPAT